MDDGNGRIRMAVVLERLDSIDKRLVSLSHIEERLRSIEIEQAKITGKVDDNRNEIDRLRGASNMLDAITGAIALIGSTIAAIVGKQP